MEATMTSVPSKGSEYAGFWVRFIAAIVDLVIYAPVFVAYRYLLDHFATHGSIDAGADYMSAQILPSNAYQWAVECVFDIVALLSYAWFLASPMKASPGMYLLKFHIADREGKRISFGRAVFWCASSVAAWLICFAGVLYMMKDILIVNDMRASCIEQKIDTIDCITEIEKVIGIPFLNFQQIIIAAAGLSLFLYVVWALSIALPKDKTGFHNLICGTRFIKGR